MRSISDAGVVSYISANIGAFHQKRLESLNSLRLERLLRRKNPYLFKSKMPSVTTTHLRNTMVRS